MLSEQLHSDDRFRMERSHCSRISRENVDERERLSYVGKSTFFFLPDSHVFRITDNLLAMARPSTEIMERYNIIEQFQR